MVLDQLAQLYLVVHHPNWSHSAENTRVITGTVNVLSNFTPLVIDAAYGNFPRLSCCFTYCMLQLCLTRSNGFINTENNFVLFYFHT